MKIGNILLRTRSSPAQMAILLLALLPVPPNSTGKSARANKAQRQTNADILRAVFDLVLAPLQQVAREGMVMDCADGKTRLCFPILSAWIADLAEHAALQGIGSKSCQKCEVLCKELSGDPQKMYETRDYMVYRDKARRHEPAEEAGIAQYLQQVARQNRQECIHVTQLSKPRRPTQAGPLAQHLPWLLQTYDEMCGRIPEKA